MNQNVVCPQCRGQAEWIGCSGCGDDMGTVVCRCCGVTMPGIPLSELTRAGAGNAPEQSMEKRCWRQG